MRTSKNMMLDWMLRGRKNRGANRTAQTYNQVSQRDISLLSDLRSAEIVEHNTLAGWSLLLAFVVVVAGGVWATWAELDEVTVGVGKVIPFGRDQTIQSLDGGILEKILVHEGDVVEKGQELLHIDDTRSSALLREGESKVNALRAQAARLRAEASGGSPQFDAELQRVRPDLVAAESNSFHSRLSALQQSLAGKQRALALAEDELQMTSPLAQKGIVSEVEVLRLRRQIAELRGHISDLRNKFKAESSAELARTESELASLRELLASRADQVKQAVVHSPVRGIVKHIRFNTIGGVIRAGEEIMQIVPTDERLLVEAKIRPADVAFLRPGMKATVKISAYDYGIYGALEGIVERISPDTLQDDARKEETFYRIHVRTNQGTLSEPNGKPLPIIPGMIATVEILTGHKTVMDYLLKPVLKARDAMREK